MNIFLIIILSIVVDYTIAYFLIRSAIIRCDSEYDPIFDIEALHIFFFVPIVNIIAPLISLVMNIGVYDFFKIKK